MKTSEVNKCIFLYISIYVSLSIQYVPVQLLMKLKERFEFPNGILVHALQMGFV